MPLPGEVAKHSLRLAAGSAALSASAAVAPCPSNQGSHTWAVVKKPQGELQEARSCICHWCFEGQHQFFAVKAEAAPNQPQQPANPPAHVPLTPQGDPGYWHMLQAATWGDSIRREGRHTGRAAAADAFGSWQHCVGRCAERCVPVSSGTKRTQLASLLSHFNTSWLFKANGRCLVAWRAGVVCLQAGNGQGNGRKLHVTPASRRHRLLAFILKETHLHISQAVPTGLALRKFSAARTCPPQKEAAAAAAALVGLEVDGRLCCSTSRKCCLHERDCM